MLASALSASAADTQEPSPGQPRRSHRSSRGLPAHWLVSPYTVVLWMPSWTYRQAPLCEPCIYPTGSISSRRSASPFREHMALDESISQQHHDVITLAQVCLTMASHSLSAHMQV